MVKGTQHGSDKTKNISYELPFLRQKDHDP
jgi:hypothetical protein